MIRIYKLDSTGKVRVLEAETSGNILIQRAGLLEGKLVENKRECKPKNTGKSNETNGEQQAILEMNSLIKDKLDKGYFKTIEEAKQGDVIMPMLAKDYKKEKAKVDWNNAFVQPKLDGMRCLAIKKDGKLTLMSRAGKVITTMPHIEKALEKIQGDFILDGELYLHGEDFQKNMTLIKKYIPGETERVKYNCYDIVEATKSFNDRYMQKNIEVYFSEHIVGVETHRISSESLLLDFHKRFIEEGFEGTMIRWGNSGYDINKRSSNLLKYKDFIDRTGIIIDVVPSDARPEQGILICSFNEPEVDDKKNNVSLVNSFFRANLKFTHKEREEILKNKKDYIGKVVELRFFEYTNDGFPRFPVAYGFRLDK